MSNKCNVEKRRLHIVLSLDNPLQRETWQLLSQATNKTRAVCEAVCGYHKQKNLEDTLRSVLQEELKRITVAPALHITENDEKPCENIDTSVLDFLRSL